MTDSYDTKCGKQFDNINSVQAHERMCEKCKATFDPPEEEAEQGFVADMKDLTQALYTLSQLSVKGLFKYVSAAGLTKEDMTQMDKTFKSLYDKYK